MTRTTILPLALAAMLSGLPVPAVAQDAPAQPTSPHAGRPATNADARPPAPTDSGAQAARPLLAPDEALAIGLGSHFGLATAREQAAVARTNRRAAVGAFLPEATAGLSHTGYPGDTVYQTSLEARLSWTIFDGFQSLGAWRRFQALDESARLAERAALEGAVEAILSAYFETVRHERRLGAIAELLAVSEERARIARARMEIGAGSGLADLQAQADLNEDSSAYLSQQVAVRDARIRLNQLLGRDPAIDFSVLDTIPLEGPLPAAQWKSELAERNAALLQSRADLRATRAGIGEARAAWMPRVTAGVAYTVLPESWNQGQGASRREGTSYTAGVTVPLFDRFQAWRGVSNARSQARLGEIRSAQRESEIRAEFAQAEERHALGLRQVALEQRNLVVARRQAEVAQERFRLGASSPLEFRDAQRRFLDAESRFHSARADAKRAELALRRLAGRLVVEAPPGR